MIQSLQRDAFVADPILQRLIPTDAGSEELSKDRETITYCRTSVRAYQAQRILDGAGFGNVRFMEGSLDGWPYDIYKANPDK